MARFYVERESALDEGISVRVVNLPDLYDMEAGRGWTDCE